MAREEVLSNETIYRQKWAMFVDNTIARRASNGGTEGVGERVELRDLMHLEEVLSKIEACSREGLGNVRASREVRKPLEAVSCLHPLFKNPSASFLDSLYPTLPPTGNYGARPKSSHQASENAHQRTGLAPTPEHCSECSTAAARASPALIPAKERGKENNHIESAGASPARGTATRVRLAADANETGGGTSRGSDATSGVTFGRSETMRGDDKLAVVSEERRRSVPPTESRNPPISPGCLRRLESLSLGPSTPAKREPSSQRPRVVHAGESPAQEVAPLCGTPSPLSEQPCEKERTLLAQTRSPPHDHDAASCRSGMVDDMYSPLFVDMLSLSARSDATHIEERTDSRVDEGTASVWSEDYEDPLGVTVLDAGDCGDDGDRAGAGAMADAILGEIDGSEKIPRGSNSGVCLDDGSVGLNSLEMTSRRSSCGPMRRISVESEESLSDAGRPGEQTCVDNILDESGPPSAQSEKSLSSRLLDESMAAVASVHAEVFAGGLASPLQPTSEIGYNSAGDDESTLDGIVESPELIRRASAGSRNPGSDRGTWRRDSDAHGGLRQGAESNVAEYFLGHSPMGSAGEEPFGSALSPAIGGFGFMNGEAPSPLAHAEPFLPTDGDATDDFGGVGLSPPRSTRSNSTAYSGAETPAQRDTSAIFDGEASGEVTLTPDASSRCLFSPPRRGEPAECDSDEPMPPPPPRQPLAPPRRGGERRQRESAPLYEAPGESREPSAAPARVECFGNSRNSSTNRSSSGGGGFRGDERNTASPPAIHNRRADDTREERISFSPASRGCGGGYAYNEQLSIGSFSDSDASRSRFGHEDGEGQGEGREEADVSLVEGTPRRRGVGSGEGLAGFYAPLAVTKITIEGRAPEHASLSTVQWSTLQWMSWREGGTTAEGEGEERRAGGGIIGDEIRGGVLGHLSVEEASGCLLALIRNNSPSTTGGRADRAGLLREETGLPQGATLLIAPTKDMLEQWSDRLGAGAGLSVLSYTMPLKERRRLSAKQAAAFDVVVTTYDILKAKEVPRTTDRAANSGKWLSRHSQEGHARAASTTEGMVSLLHGVRWNRVVADGAQILANPRSARAVAVAGLVGGARWCVVERESMATVENASDRMRSLTAFLGVPAEVPLVEAAECLFYHSRPSHIARLPPRGSAADTSTIIADDSPCSQRSGGGSARTPLVDGNPGKLDEPLAGQSNGSKYSKGNAGLRERGGRRGAVGRACVSSTDATQNGCGRGAEGGGAGAGVGLSRSDVTYAATILRFRRPQASDLAGRGRCRDEREPVIVDGITDFNGYIAENGLEDGKQHVLVLGGRHASNVNLGVIQLVMTLNIELLQLPSSSSHRTQPVVGAAFGDFKKAATEVLAIFPQ